MKTRASCDDFAIRLKTSWLKSSWTSDFHGGLSQDGISPGSRDVLRYFLTCVVWEMCKLWTTLETALGFRSVELALREGPRQCGAKRTEEQIVNVPVLQLKEKPVQRRMGKQRADVPVVGEQRMEKQIVDVLVERL